MENPPLPDLCLHCNTELHQTDVKAEMPCHRFLHSRCLIQMTREQDFNHFDTCQPCGLLFPAEVEEDNQSVHSQVSVTQNKRTRLRNLFETDETFRKKTKELAKAKVTSNKARTGVKKVIKTKKGDIRNQLLLIRAQVQGLLEGKRDEVRESQEYKQFLSAERKYSGLKNYFLRHYNCSARDIATHLNDKPGLRRFSEHRYYYFSKWRLMGRPWHYRIPL